MKIITRDSIPLFVIWILLAIILSTSSCVPKEEKVKSSTECKECKGEKGGANE